MSTPAATSPIRSAAIVVGAGPAGLASAACLIRRGVQATVLEAGPAAGSSWRGHYDRLHLHTVKQHSSLPGLPFPDDVGRYPSRADVVAYLERYAAHFGIVPLSGERVLRVRPAEGAIAVDSDRGQHLAPVVVVATGRNRVPNPDRLPEQERFRGTIVHSARYRTGAAFRGQRVLVVGAGNSGAEIAVDLVENSASPTLAVRSPVNIVPLEFLGMPMQLTSIRLRKLPTKMADAIGRAASRLAFGNLSRYGLARPLLGPLSSIKLHGRIPLIDVGTIAAIKQGTIAVKPGVQRLTDEGAVFADGSIGSFDAVVLATGFRPELAEIVQFPDALEDQGRPRDWKGGGAYPGLYFVGFRDVSTGLLREIGIEAETVAGDVAARLDRSRM
jgi:indole-3-pyruvate monooxygenase